MAQFSYISGLNAGELWELSGKQWQKYREKWKSDRKIKVKMSVNRLISIQALLQFNNINKKNNINNNAISFPHF